MGVLVAVLLVLSPARCLAPVTPRPLWTATVTRSSVGIDMTRLEFIAQIVPACKVAEARHGIPWKWLVCEAIQESGGYGQSDLSINAHNQYGIKGKDYYQGNVGYAKFMTWAECILFQGWQLNQSRYVGFKPLILAGKFAAYGNAIQEAGWCAPSMPGYGDMIEDIAEQYRTVLNSYDTQPAPVAKLSEAQQWAVDNKIFNVPVQWDKPVDYNTLAWALFKARKVGNT